MAELTQLDQPIKLVIFDLDGTLLDSVPQLFLATQAALQANGFADVTLEQVKGWIGNGRDMLLRRAMEQQDQPSPVTDPTMLDKVRQTFNQAYHHGLTRDYAVYPDVQSTLLRLQQAGYRLAVVTNKPHAFVEPLLQAAGLLPRFDLILGGDVLPVRKPDPAPLWHVCHALGIAPAHSLMVGDSRNDVLAAQAAGMPVVGLTYGYNHGEPISACRPDWVLNHFGQLADLLLAS